MTSTSSGGFDPSNGTSFVIMDYSSESGTLSITDPNFNRGTQHWVITSYDGVAGPGIVLTAEADPVPPTPEPDSILLFGTGLISLVGWFSRKTNSGVLETEKY